MRVWAVPIEITEHAYVIVHAEDTAEAREKAERGEWAERVPRGEVREWQVAGPPERQTR